MSEPNEPDFPETPREAFRILIEGFEAFLTKLKTEMEEFAAKVKALHERFDHLDDDEGGTPT